jgi:hypothetical protein
MALSFSEAGGSSHSDSLLQLHHVIWVISEKNTFDRHMHLLESREVLVLNLYVLVETPKISSGHQRQTGDHRLMF